MIDRDWAGFAASTLQRGWSSVDLAGDGLGAELNSLRGEALELFTTLMSGGVDASRSQVHTGQSGLTVDADEGDYSLIERRSHLVFNLSPGRAHPFSMYRPWFYGGDADPEAAVEERFAVVVLRLHRILDYATSRAFEAMEAEAELGFGTLSGPMAIGERLLRFQWYPEVRQGVPTVFDVNTPVGSVPILGHSDGNRRIVRASPHTDTGHWTWQVAASDDAVRFWDPATAKGVGIPSRDALSGNVCDFLELELRARSAGARAAGAPVHWVDLLDGASPRASLSYFAHTRPGVTSAGEPAGLRLYRRLGEMGYGSRGDVEAVRRLLQRVELDDRRMLVAAVACERQAGVRPPAGFAAPLSRYYDGNGRLASAPRAPLEA